jgi:hypothetical protein
LFLIVSLSIWFKFIFIRDWFLFFIIVLFCLECFFIVFLFQFNFLIFFLLIIFFHCFFTSIRLATALWSSHRFQKLIWVDICFLDSFINLIYFQFYPSNFFYIGLRAFFFFTFLVVGLTWSRVYFKFFFIVFFKYFFNFISKHIFLLRILLGICLLYGQFWPLDQGYKF